MRSHGFSRALILWRGSGVWDTGKKRRGSHVEYRSYHEKGGPRGSHGSVGVVCEGRTP